MISKRRQTLRCGHCKRTHLAGLDQRHVGARRLTTDLRFAAGQRITQRTLRIGVSARIFHPEPGASGLRGKTLGLVGLFRWAEARWLAPMLRR